jgi:hypothetical protein
VTNTSAFTTGSEEETPSAQKTRFQEFIESQARGVLQSIEYGAKLAQLTDANGTITESVKQAKASEDLPTRKGEVDLYVWNGVGVASDALKTEVSTILTGYYDTDNNPVYGYKPAGVMVNIYSAPIKYVTIKLSVTSEVWATLESLKSIIENLIDSYFGALKQGDTAIQTALEAKIKYIDGVNDVKLYFSLDSGVTWITDNITTTENEIAVVQKPLIYE